MTGLTKQGSGAAGRAPLLTVVWLSNPRIEFGDEMAALSEVQVESLAADAVDGLWSGKPHADAHDGYRPDRIGARLNVAISLAAGEWILVLFGDEDLRQGWLAQLCKYLSFDAECRERDLLVCRSAAERCLPLLIIRRQAFVYGALDAGFECERLVLWHWLHQTYEARRSTVLASAGAVEQGCDWLAARAAPAMMTRPLSALAGFGLAIDPDVRLVLLDCALTAPDRTIADLAEMRQEAALQAAERKSGSPYFSGDYEPRRFWEENTRGYVRWEAYQPDEMEIAEIASRIRPVSVLELGCGVGRNARYFSAASRYSGIDISTNLLLRGFARRQQNWLGNVCGTITRLPFADASWDLIFADSTVQHVIPGEIVDCIREIMRVSARYVCLIEYTAEEAAGGTWFKQVHMFPHDYQKLFAPYCNLIWHAETSLRVHPARKEVFLFEKRR